MKRKFCLTPNPSQAGLDIPSVPKVTERLRDIRLDRDMCAQASCHRDDPVTSPITGRDVNIGAVSQPVDTTSYRTPLDRQFSAESDGLGPPWGPKGSPGYPEDVFEDIKFQVGSLSSSLSSSFCQSLGQADLESITRLRSATITPGDDITDRKLPTVFRWEGGGKSVYLSGSFDGWKTKIPMVRSQGDFYTIVELPEGQHQYKFLVDEEWVCDTNVPQLNNDLGSKNNNVKVSASDFEVFEALAMDSVSTSEKSSGSPSGEYSQHIPARASGTGFHHGGPPVLPPHLLQVILNKEIPLHCEPTLLPEPNHVMLNHLYALSIKDGVMVLSATHRYRKKYVTTLLYKPI